MSGEQTPVWTGEMAKGDGQNTVVGYLVDHWGWRVEITGTYDPATRRYVLVGKVAPAPEALRVPGLDETVEEGATAP